jgi:uncharacterized protein (DUF302 family)
VSAARALQRLLLVITLAFSATATADELIMARVPAAFPETMSTLQEVIREHGYTVSRVQRVDVGLTKTGYQTAEYRVVFFGKPEQVKKLPQRYPELVPYMPLSVTIFAERDETLLVSLNPSKLAEFYPQKELKKYFEEWEQAVVDIVEKVKAEESR